MRLKHVLAAGLTAASLGGCAVFTTTEASSVSPPVYEDPLTLGSPTSDVGAGAAIPDSTGTEI